MTLFILPLLMLPFDMRPDFCGVDGAIFVILLLDDTFPLLPFCDTSLTVSRFSRRKLDDRLSSLLAAG